MDDKVRQEMKASADELVGEFSVTFKFYSHATLTSEHVPEHQLQVIRWYCPELKALYSEYIPTPQAADDLHYEHIRGVRYIEDIEHHDFGMENINTAVDLNVTSYWFVKNLEIENGKK